MGLDNAVNAAATLGVSESRYVGERYALERMSTLEALWIEEGRP
jgi:hypothetical protein